MKKYLLYILSIFLLLSCQDSIETPQTADANDAPDLTGQAILFTAGFPAVDPKTRSLTFTDQDGMDAEVSKYKPAGSTDNGGYDHGYNYIYNIEMFKAGETGSVSLGNADYQLASNGLLKRTDGMLELAFPSDPETTNTALFWPDNVNGYGFHVTAGEDDIHSDQDSRDKFFRNDRLEGYGFSPVFSETEDLEGLNFHSNKTWYTNNKTWLGDGKTQELYKAVPLFLQHKHAWVSIILKSGKGIPREYLSYEKTSNGFDSEMYYYNGTTQKKIKYPWRRPWHVDYEVADSYGGIDTDKNHENTTMLHAIIEPTNFLDNPENLIGKITLNDLKFTYAPLNDNSYTAWKDNKDKTGDEYEALSPEIKDAIAKMQAYNVTAGKHLKITATLSTDKIVLITALLEDWDEVSMTSICDDYGQNGNPEIIKTRDQLKEFLQNENKNKPGTTALIAATELTLDRVAQAAVKYTQQEIDDANAIINAEGYVAGSNPDAETVATKTTDDVKTPAVTAEAWPTNLDLNCTLNLAGATLHTRSQMLNSISESGTLINGSVEVMGMNSETGMPAAISESNKGLIEQVTVLVDEDARKNVWATKGGMVGTNYGIIINCANNLQVKGSTGYIGGIAGESKKGEGMTTSPIIDNCVVNARVGTSAMTAESMDAISGAGGIAGYAEGRISRCDFTYGMTLMQQDNAKYKNIVAATTTNSETTDLIVNAYGNSWPTLEENGIGSGSNINNNTYASYNAVLDCQEELRELLERTQRDASGTSRYQIADDFIVDDSWDLGLNEDISLPNGSGQQTGGNSGENSPISSDQKYHLNFELDGNDKTITTSGKMLFTNINGYFHDFTVYCSQSIISTTSPSSTEGIAPLAFSVNGQKGKLENIKVKMAADTKIQASTPSGLVVLAYGGATIENCEVKVKIEVKYADDFSEADAWKFAGGIVACATDVTISGCQVHNGTTIKPAALTSSLTKRNKQYRGGIVGGIVARSGNTPKTVIIDCNSWWGDAVQTVTDEFSPAGSIIGSAHYVNSQNQTVYGMDKGKSSGNWWPEGSPYKYKAAADISSETEMNDYIGRKNSVNPDAVTDF